MASIRAFPVGPYAPQPQPQLPPLPPHQQQLPPPPPPSATTMAPVILYQYGMPYDGTTTTSFPAAPPPSKGVPIQQIRFPSSPSPLPAWIAGSSKPIYMAPSTQPHLPPLPTTGAVMAHGGAPASGVLYGGVDGGSLMPTLSATSPSLDSTGAAPSTSSQDPPPVVLSWAEDLNLVRCVGDLGHVVSPTGGRHAIFPASGGWGGASLHLVLHRKPSALLCAVQTSSRLAGRRRGVTSKSAPRSTVAWSLLRPLPDGHTHVPFSSRWCPWDPGGYTHAGLACGWCPPYVQESKNKEFQSISS